MKLPAGFNEVTMYEDFEPHYPYPPLGFHPFWEHELGNGDMFGLYWPIGREEADPIVAEMWHDAWCLAPHFSSLERFLECSRQLEEDGFPETPSLDFDADSPRACFESARSSLKANAPEIAIELLESAVAVLPEYTEALAILATQYRRVGRVDDAIQTGIRAVISPPSFGRDSSIALRLVAGQKGTMELLQDDPIWKSRSALKWNFGGEKLNDDYLILREAIDIYLDQDRIIEAITLAQTYGELMSGETVSFQERYSFRAEEHVAWQIRLCENHLGRSRLLQ